MKAALKAMVTLLCLTVGLTANASRGGTESDVEVKENRLVVKLSPSDYQQMQELRKRRLLVLKNEEQFLAEMNYLIIKEQVENERLFHLILRYSALDSKKFSRVIEKIRVAVETQQQLDEKFGTGTLKLTWQSLQQGDGSSNRNQQGDRNAPTTPEPRQQMTELRQ